MRLLYGLTLLAVPLGLLGADPPRSRPQDQWTIVGDRAPTVGGKIDWFEASLRKRDDPKAPAVEVKKDAPKFARGAKRSPGHRLAGAPRFALTQSPPAKFAMIPAVLGMYGNGDFGDCVSAQTACSMVAWTTYCGAPVEPTDAEVIAFARKYGLLNGADLTQVMDIMSSKGMTVGGKVYKEGGYATVDYSVPITFQAALTVGPVNVAIDANALPSGAGNQQGWYALGTYRRNQFPNTDHCVTFLGYGTAADCYGFLKLPVPAGVNGTQQAYIMDTWKTLGVVNQSWVMSTMEEAWVRNPTTVGFSPPTPPTPPLPPTPPNPPLPPTPPNPPTPGTGFTGTITDTTTTAYANGVKGASVTITSVSGANPGGLDATGINPLIVADVLKLFADIRAKAGREAILADVLKILSDLGP